MEIEQRHSTFEKTFKNGSGQAETLGSNAVR